ncbi:hypothetical protein LCGC14_1020140 [marine sediment metagenome]|uniref:DUF6884 domain-containing protein n=1 Tax=marine sediment metagenome TaxID=412755 RepID=A0A0F9MXM7_9ZZZZ
MRLKVLVLAGCSQKKLNYPAPAIELNQGQLFRGIKKLTMSNNFDLKILSGKYGLLDSNEIIAPYNQKIRTKKDILRIRRRIFPKMLKTTEIYDLIIVIMGKNYREVIEPLFNENFIIIYDKRGIGGYLSLISKFNKLPTNQLLKELEKFRFPVLKHHLLTKEMTLQEGVN